MRGKSTNGRLNLVVALNCEARPLLRRYRLRQYNLSGGLRIYSGDQGISLLVTGIGKFAVASGCGFLAGLQQQTAGPAAWLNIGIAGHGSQALGEGVLVNKVTDRATGQRSYPPVLFDPGCPQSELITVDSPEVDYAEAAAYDMEGSVFFATANRFASSEFCQLYKIVSDGPEAHVSGVTEKAVESLVTSRLEQVDHLVTTLLALSDDYNSIYGLPDECRQIASLTALTASQKIQLEKLYRRYYALGGSSLGGRLDTQGVLNGRELLRRVGELVPDL